MSIHILETKTTINRPLAEVFEFFSKAENLETLTPSIVNFKILTPLPIKMKVGTLIDYRIKVEGIPFHWLTKITAWELGKHFVDEQIKGPYKKWRHEHVFMAVGNATVMIDRVEYESPGWILEPIIHQLFVKKRVQEIFAYREKVLAELFKD